jgi:hypothetical protein
MRVFPWVINYGTMTVNCPGTDICITPPHMHMHLDELFRVGKLFTITVGAPTTHGATVMGMQGMGVMTPNAAAVAAITMGLAMLMHIPNGGMLATGAKSMIVAAKGPPAMTGGPLGIAINVLGAAPKEHIIMAPVHT